MKFLNKFYEECKNIVFTGFSFLIVCGIILIIFLSIPILLLLSVLVGISLFPILLFVTFKDYIK